MSLISRYFHTYMNKNDLSNDNFLTWTLLNEWSMGKKAVNLNCSCMPHKQLQNGKIHISMMEWYNVIFIFYPWSFERALCAKYKTNKATSVAANSLLIVWPCDEPCKTKNCKLTNVDCIQSKSL